MSSQDPLASYNDGFLIRNGKSQLHLDLEVLDSLSYQISAAREKLQIYFPSYTTQMLLQEQAKDLSLQNLYKNHPNTFIKILV